MTALTNATNADTVNVSCSGAYSTSGGWWTGSQSVALLFPSGPGTINCTWTASATAGGSASASASLVLACPSGQLYNNLTARCVTPAAPPPSPPVECEATQYHAPGGGGTMLTQYSQGLSAGQTTFDEYQFDGKYSASCMVVTGPAFCRADFSRSTPLYTYYRFTCVPN